MKKLIPLIACLALASCKKKIDNDAVRRPPIGKSGIRFYYHAAADKCFYQASEWRMTSAAHGEVLVVSETDCTEKVRAIAEAIAEPSAAAEAAP